MLRKLLAGLGLGALAAVIVLGLAASTDLLDRYELNTYDWRMRLAADPATLNKDIVLVAVNDLSIRQLQDGYRMRWPWPRVAFGLAIDFLRRGGAKVVAVDFSFTERDHVVTYVFDDPNDKWSGPQSDRALAEWTRESGRVVMLADAVYLGIEGADQKDANATAWRGSPFRMGPLAEPRPLVLAPYQELADAAAALGHNLTPVMTTVPRGECRRSSSARARSCRRSAWPPRYSPAGSAPMTSAPRVMCYGSATAACRWFTVASTAAISGRC